MKPATVTSSGPFWSALLLCALAARPPLAYGQGEGKAPEKKTEKKAEKKPEKEALPVEEDPSDPASPNLQLPQDLSDSARKAITEAIEAYRGAVAATGGEKQLTQAIAKLKSASGKAPKCAVPYYYLGIAYQGKKNFVQARTVLEKALKFNAGFHEALVELADVNVWQKKLKESIALYDKAIAMAPAYGVAHERKAIALVRMGDFVAAKDEAVLAIKAKPTLQRTRLLVLVDRELKGPGWESTYTAETENYRVQTPVSEEFAKEVANAAELIRRAYNRIFSDIEKPARKYAVLVYPSKEAYHKAGAPEQWAGHYDPFFRKLVLFRQPKKEDTIRVLNHEAFHQYLHDYLELAPQWFNEGLGDYFSSFEHQRQGDREVMVSRPNPGRLRDVQYGIRTKVIPPASDLMTMTRAEMYDARMAGFHYAEAWALMYFMIEGNKPEYKRILIAYFGALRKGKDLDEAFDSTFGKLDMGKFDMEWRGFISSLGGKP